MNSKERLEVLQDLAQEVINGDPEAISEISTALDVVKALQKIGEMPLRQALANFGRYYLSGSAEQLAKALNTSKTTILRIT